MNLSECKLGLIVKNNEDIGHITGLVWNGNQVIPEVLFANSKHPRGIHQGNISILKKGEGE